MPKISQRVADILGLEPRNREWVYFLLNRASGYIKIGHSVDPVKRMHTLQVGNSGRLELLGAVPGGKKIEEVYHHAWRHQRVRGEWFAPHPQLRHYAERCTWKLDYLAWTFKPPAQH
jgi:hypothetical protein